MTPTPSPIQQNDPMATIFASMVMQQTQMTLMLLGEMPHPETGETVTDLEGAKMFIDQLEMLEAKTKGNLGKDEAQLLKQSLVGTRMAFVAAVEQQEKTAKSAAPPAATAVADQPAPAPVEGAGPAADDDSRKKFSKKY
jgi:hypothetical protein